MKRIPIQIDDATHERLRKKAFAEKRSIASIVRESIDRAFATTTPRSPGDFPFVASGRTKPPADGPVSENHDAAVVDSFRRTRRR